MKKNCKGWIGATAIGLGGANLSIFVLGALINGQGTSTILLLIVGLLISLLAAPGYLELTLMYPEKVGGITAVCVNAFRFYNPVLANLAGTCYWFAWVPAASFAAIFVASAIQVFFIPSVSVAWLSTGLILLVTAVCFCGLPTMQKVAIPIAAIAATLAVLSGLIPVCMNHLDWSQLLHLQLKTPFEGLFGKVTSFMAGLYLIGWVAPAFESCLCFVGETENPKKNVPRSLLVTILFSILYFSILPAIWLITLSADTLAKDALGQEIWVCYAALLGSFAKLAGAWFIIFNMLICIFTPLAGPPRTLAQLAKDGLLPFFFGLKTKREVPWASTLITALFAIIIIWIGAPTWLMAATNFEYLLGISLASVAVLLLRKNAPDALRLFRAPRYFIGLGLLSGLLWISSTILGFQQFGLLTMLIGILFSFIGVIFYTWQKIIEKKQNKQKFKFKSLHIKLTGTMITVLVIDAIGYLIAVNNVTASNTDLIAALEDIFVIVALLTLSVGLVLPGMIAHAAEEVSQAAKNLVKGTLGDFSKAMVELGSGNLDKAYAQTNIYPIPIRSEDEIGEMAASFNEMQNEIKRSAEGLIGARNGLLSAREQLTTTNLALQELNTTLEKRVQIRTKHLEKTNKKLKEEIKDRIKAEENAALLSSQLIAASRHAGMADIATSVLHNVGNVLNSINISTSVIANKLTQSEISNLHKLAEIFEQNQNNLINLFLNDTKGEELIKYLLILSKDWQVDHENIIEETQVLDKNIQHIKNIISVQQELSKASAVTEIVSIEEVLEDALKFNRRENLKIDIIKDYSPIKKVILDKIKLLQIVINLIKNAIDALFESQTKNKKLILEIHPKDLESFEIKIIDNGVGISKENLNKIFSHGFTTKKSGHGFGLHTSALYAIEMGGALVVNSEGVNKGATFILTLPYEYKDEKPPQQESKFI